MLCLSGVYEIGYRYKKRHGRTLASAETEPLYCSNFRRTLFESVRPVFVVYSPHKHCRGSEESFFEYSFWLSKKVGKRLDLTSEILVLRV